MCTSTLVKIMEMGIKHQKNWSTKDWPKMGDLRLNTCGGGLKSNTKTQLNTFVRESLFNLKLRPRYMKQAMLNQFQFEVRVEDQSKHKQLILTAHKTQSEIGQK